MATDLVWLEQAEDDLQAIFDYISAENPRAAMAYVDAILEICARLRGFPLSGRTFDKRYRILVARNHLVFYRYSERDDEVVIAAVIDGRRDADVFLRKLSSLEP